MTYTHLHFCYRFLTFVPAIQEFCLFASIGLLVDFYLQMVFFATILSIDIRRLELSDLDRGHAYLHVQVSELVGCVGKCSTILFFRAHRRVQSMAACNDFD